MRSAERDENRPRLLEKALAARPGRVDQAIYFPLPDRDCRRRLFDHFAAGLDLSAVDPVPLPSGLGLEAAGVVESVGENVTTLVKGDRVAYCTGPIGSYAEANNVPADRVAAPRTCGSFVRRPTGREMAAELLLY